MQAPQLTVTALNEYVRKSLAMDPMLRYVSLSGEISNFKQHVTGHWYFSLKDDKSRIACVLFRQNAMNVRFYPQDGMRVVLSGSVGLYSASGSYQFYAESMRKDGMGELYEQYLRLKEQLAAEGLFDPARKKMLPLLPRIVGVATSSTGAVIHDICNVVSRRCPCVQILLRSSLVQGEGAAADLKNALKELAAVPEVDVIVIGRGGGSMEDLWAFNDEQLVRAIAACPKPVISAVGHETDVTLADFAADMRAPTPSAAGELAVPDKNAMLEKLASMRGALLSAAAGRYRAARTRVLEQRMHLAACHPGQRLRQTEGQLNALRLRMDHAAESALHRALRKLEKTVARLRSAGPEDTLRRGYAIVMAEGKIIKRAEHMPRHFTLRLVDGEVSAVKEG